MFLLFLAFFYYLNNVAILTHLHKPSSIFVSAKLRQQFFSTMAFILADFPDLSPFAPLIYVLEVSKRSLSIYSC